MKGFIQGFEKKSKKMGKGEKWGEHEKRQGNVKNVAKREKREENAKRGKNASGNAKIGPHYAGVGHVKRGKT